MANKNCSVFIWYTKMLDIICIIAFMPLQGNKEPFKAGVNWIFSGIYKFTVFSNEQLCVSVVFLFLVPSAQQMLPDLEVFYVFIF